MEILTEDQILPTAGATPNASVGTGAEHPCGRWRRSCSRARPARADRSGGADRRDGDGGQRQRDGQLDRAVQRRQPDHQLHGHAVHRHQAQTADHQVTGSPPVTNATVTGLTNGTTYTFTVTATNVVGTGPRRRASNAVTPAAPTARARRPA